MINFGPLKLTLMKSDHNGSTSDRCALCRINFGRCFLFCHTSLSFGSNKSRQKNVSFPTLLRDPILDQLIILTHFLQPLLCFYQLLMAICPPMCHRVSNIEQLFFQRLCPGHDPTILCSDLQAGLFVLSSLCTVSPGLDANNILQSLYGHPAELVFWYLWVYLE